MMLNSTAFDAVAKEYDSEFTESRLGRMLRQRTWQVLAACFTAGQHVLELTCGTGADAVWLAKRGVRVTATDGSAAMVKIAVMKAQQAGVAERVHGVQVSLQEISNGRWPEEKGHLFDGVYSNFGGLNTTGEWRPLATALANLVRPGGKVVLVPMGPVCPWEVGWYLLHGEAKIALRRAGRAATATIGATTIPVWYPSAGQLRREFQPWFRPRQTESLGLWLPPSYLSHLVNRWPGLFARLNRLEQKTARLTGGWGDHYISVFERVASCS